MLISSYTIFLAMVFTMMCGMIFHLLIPFYGFILSYILAIIEVVINRTIIYIPDFVSHLQGINWYFTILFTLITILGSMWINLKHHQLTKYITSPFGWLYYFINSYINCIFWMMNLSGTIIGKFFGFIFNSPSKKIDTINLDNE